MLNCFEGYVNCLGNVRNKVKFLSSFVTYLVDTPMALKGVTPSEKITYIGT